MLITYVKLHYSSCCLGQDLTCDYHRILLALVNILSVLYWETVVSQDGRETKTLFDYHINKNQFTGFRFLQNDYKHKMFLR